MEMRLMFHCGRIDRAGLDGPSPGIAGGEWGLGDAASYGSTRGEVWDGH